MAVLLSCRSIGKTYGVRTILKGITLAFDDGERIGLVGANGSGKSTLLKILAGAEAPDEGEISTRRNLRLGYLPQEDDFPAGQTIQQILEDALADQHMEDFQRSAQASIFLSKYGFTDPSQEAVSLSGGWRKRLAIARALIRQPDLLLLDEPTNHLDMEGILWLEQLLRNPPFGFVLVSHDRYLLENVTNRVIELSEAFPDSYFSAPGVYSDFLEKRQEFLAAQLSQQAVMESRVRREIEWLKRGPKARTTKARSRVDAAGRMMTELAELKQRNAQGRTVSIDFTGTDRKSRKLLVARDVSQHAAGRPLFTHLDLILSPAMRLGILGPNGSGKTTLLRLLAGELAPGAGEIRRAEGLRIVHFTQDRDQLDRAQTLRRALSPKSDIVVYRDGSTHISSWARRFLFRTEQLDLPVGDLSGGEQARVLIARLMLQPADLLLLDQPTNDLDIPTLEVLEESLEDFPGAVVVVTHDRFMLDRLSADILGLDGRGDAHLYADLVQWESAQQEAAAQEIAARKPAPARPAAPPAPKPAGKRLTYMEQREWEQIEANIMAAESAVDDLRRRMEDPAVLASRDQLHDVCEQLGHAEERVRQLYARWETLDAKQKGA